MFVKFNCTIRFRDKVYGGVPKSREIIQNYVRGKYGSDDTTLMETDVDLDMEEETEKITNVFRCDDRGIYIGSYQVKAAIKQYASLCRFTVKKRGTKQTVKESLFVKGRIGDEFTGEKIYFQELATKADGTDDIAGQVSTPQGQRSILKASEFMLRRTLQFEVWILDVRVGTTAASKDLTADDLRFCLEFGQECGIGSNRTYESGKYNLLVYEQFEPVPKTKKKKGVDAKEAPVANVAAIPKAESVPRPKSAAPSLR